jgi:uncharacterized repeat protein (TIGR01451 family)
VTSISKWMKAGGGGDGATSRLVITSAGGVLMAGALGFAAWAAAPPAGTVIGNQASASYVDPNGTPQLATSNIVQTTVQQVGSFTLNGGNTNSLTSAIVQNTKTGAAGSTLYAPHVLTNTGNGTDVFDITVIPDAGAPFARVEIFADANGDGLPDGAALCTSPSPATGAACTVDNRSVAGNNGTFQFVVAYQIPANATTPLTPYSFGTVSAQVDASSPVFASYPSTQSSNRDNINLTNLAAFNVSKSISAPAVAAADGGAWNFVSNGGERSSSASCGTTFATITAGPACQYTTYTIRYDNTGGASGRFAMQDVLPSGFTYVAGSAVWSNAGGAPLNETGVVTGGLEYRVAGNTISVVDQNLPVNTTRTISMVVLVNNTAAIGTGTTTNTVEYSPVDAAGATTLSLGTLGSLSNPSAFTVLPSYGFAVGSSSSTALTARDTVAGTPNAGPNDVTTIASAAPGTAISFTKQVFNTGNAADAIDLSVASSTFPAGTVFTFFAADGVTPLVNSGGSSNVDTGPVAAGGSTTIVVRANLPASATVGSGGFTANVLGTSAGAPATQAPGDATQIALTTVIGSLVDLTNSALGTGSGSVANGDLGPGPSPQPTLVNTTQPGVGTVFPLFIRNNDTIANDFNITASQTASFPGSLPAGWTFKLVAAGGTCAAPALTGPVSVPAGNQVEVAACVTPPAIAPAAQTTVYFQAQSATVASNGLIASDRLTDAVIVTLPQTYVTSLTPNNSGQIAPGGSVTFAHTLTNLGTLSCNGGYSLSATVPAAELAAGWTAPALYLDVNENGVIDAADTLVTGPITSDLVAGDSQAILVRVFAPGNAVAGASATYTVVATFTDTNCGAPTATDVANVITGQIRVVKQQALDALCDGTPDTALAANPVTARPGQCLFYDVVATNEGAAPVTNVTVSDSVPPYTALNGAQPAVQCVSTGLTGTAVTYAASGTSVSCGSAANTLAPGGTVSLNFVVRIDN